MGLLSVHGRIEARFLFFSSRPDRRDFIDQPQGHIAENERVGRRDQNGSGLHGEEMLSAEEQTVGEHAELLAQLHGKTLGVFGTGAIGTHVAKLARAFGMTVLEWSARRNRPAR